MASCAGFLSFLKSFDMFSVSTSLRYKGESSYKTWIGFIGTLAFYAVFFWAVITIGASVLSKSDPSIQESEDSVVWPSQLAFHPDSFPLVLGVESKNPSVFFIDETTYVPVVEERIKYSNNSRLVKTLKVVPCDPKRHGVRGYSSSYFQTLFKNSKLYCVDEDTSISGDYNAENFTYIRVGFSSCANSSANNYSCKPSATIASTLQIGYASIYFPTYNKDFSNYERPMTDIGTDVFTSIGYLYTKYTDVYFEETKVVTDSGLLFPIYNTESYFLHSEKREMFDLVSMPSKFAYFDLKMSTRVVTYNRSYLKIIDFISNVGGFVNVIFVALVILADPLTEFLYLIDLLNIMYKKGSTSKYKSKDIVDLEDEKPYKDTEMDTQKKLTTDKKEVYNSTIGKDIGYYDTEYKNASQSIDAFKGLTVEVPKTPDGKNSKIVPFGTATPLTRFNVLDSKRIKNFESLLKAYQDVHMEKKTFHINVCQYIGYKIRGVLGIFCKKLKNKNYEKYKNWFRKIESKIEMSYILTKLREIDKLKLLLLNKDQIVLFDYLTKPIISEDNNKNTSEKLWDYLENPEEHRQDAYVSYEKIKTRDSLVDKKLLELLDTNIKKALENWKS